MRVCAYCVATCESFSVLFKGYVDNRLVKYLTAATLCSVGCYESFRMIITVAVGFLCKLNCTLYSCLEIVISRKLFFIFEPFHSEMHCRCHVVKCI
jgi:hypothetical protein